MNWVVPVCSCANACGCAGRSVAIELTTHSSSACRATSSKRVEIQSPLSPRRRNSARGGRSVARPPRAAAAGAARPASATSRGLWSKVSTCDGPPCMQRKITRRARGVKWGGRAASGPAATARRDAAAAMLANAR